MTPFKQHHLGRSNFVVPEICLGTMTFGEQTSEADAHAQLDWAFDNGINFFDTAEMYAVPPRAALQSRDFRLFLLVRFCSNVAHLIQVVAIADFDRRLRAPLLAPAR